MWRNDPARCACCALAGVDTPATQTVRISPGDYQSGPNDYEAEMCDECAYENCECEERIRPEEPYRVA
jgi:hypothetical protein